MDSYLRASLLCSMRGLAYVVGGIGIFLIGVGFACSVAGFFGVDLARVVIGLDSEGWKSRALPIFLGTICFMMPRWFKRLYMAMDEDRRA